MTHACDPQVMRFINEVHAASSSLPLVTSPTPPPSAPKRLSFNLTPEIKAAIMGARKTFDATIARTRIANLRTEAFTTDVLKKGKVRDAPSSPPPPQGVLLTHC